jgi:hypothetical protein
LCDPLRRLTEADQSEASAHGRLREKMRHVVLAREVDGRLGACSRRRKLALKVV